MMMMMMMMMMMNRMMNDDDGVKAWTEGIHGKEQEYFESDTK